VSTRAMRTKPATARKTCMGRVCLMQGGRSALRPCSRICRGPRRCRGPRSVFGTVARVMRWSRFTEPAPARHTRSRGPSSRS
jgi:hypothetical protein